MIARILKALALAALVLPFAAGAALAHPHVYVTMKSDIVYDAEGRMTGIVDRKDATQVKIMELASQ